MDQGIAITQIFKPKIPELIQKKWQKIVDLMAKICDVPAGLIMQVHETEIEVFLRSNTQNNPYKRGEKAHLNTGLYCETVMETRQKLLVPNALKDPVWDHNPDIELNMIYYLGFPIVWPDGQIFGTICVLDFNQNDKATKYTELLEEFCDIVQRDLVIIVQENELRDRYHQLQAAKNELQLLNSELERRVKLRTMQLENANKALEVNERKYRSLFENIHEAFCLNKMIVDKNGKPIDFIFLEINPAFESTTGKRRDKIIGKGIRDIFPGIEKDTVDWINILAKVAITGEGINFEEYSGLLKRWFFVICFSPAEGKVALTFTDITGRKQAEECIKRNLKEKEVLLKEIHHRVKNNMQIMSSLLNLQTRKIDDEQITLILNEVTSRIKSMAIIHEIMYQNQDFDRINMKNYIEKLCLTLRSLYYQSAQRIKIIDKSKNIWLDLNQSIPCGMIMNELLSNSMKHAFPEGTNGEIKICIEKKGNKIYLTVCDNGVELPVKFDPYHSETIGMSIIRDLTCQLDGEFEFSQDGENHKIFQIVFLISK